MGKILTVHELYKTVMEIIRNTANDSAAFETVQLIFNRTGLDRAAILTCGEKTVESDICDSIIADAIRRKSGEPLQYILGEWEFFGRTFSVGEGVLIPRADTETLVETALCEIKPVSSPRVLDLCTGSGCIAVSIALERTDSCVIAADLYPVPLKTAAENAARNHASNVTVIKNDVFNPNIDSKFDIIVSNPPYISANEMKELSHEVTHEPKEALFGGNDGLDFYRALAEKWVCYLNPGGKMAVEVGYNQSDDVLFIFSKVLSDVHSVNDLNGIKRVITGTYNPN